jgi:hypothetical protein
MLEISPNYVFFHCINLVLNTIMITSINTSTTTMATTSSTSATSTTIASTTSVTTATTTTSMWFVCYFSLWTKLLELINPSGKNQDFEAVASSIYVKPLAAWSLSPRYATRILMNKVHFASGYFDEVEHSKV